MTVLGSDDVSSKAITNTQFTWRKKSKEVIQFTSKKSFNEAIQKSSHIFAHRYSGTEGSNFTFSVCRYRNRTSKPKPWSFRIKNRNCIRAVTSLDTKIGTLSRSIQSEDRIGKGKRSINGIFRPPSVPFSWSFPCLAPSLFPTKWNMNRMREKSLLFPPPGLIAGPILYVNVPLVKLHYSPWAERRNRIWFWTTVREELWHLRQERIKNTSSLFFIL